MELQCSICEGSLHDIQMYVGMYAVASNGGVWLQHKQIDLPRAGLGKV